MKKILVYTVVTKSEKTLPTVMKEDNIDYYCYTNDPDFQTDNWNIRYIDDNQLSDTMFLKKYKICGDSKVEEKYDIVIYIDAYVKINQSFERIINENCDFQKNLVYFLEDSDNCTYQVSKKFIEYGLDNTAIIRTQIDYYQKQNFPKNYGFLSDKIIIRKIDKEFSCVKWQDAWYHQLEQFSMIETLSLMYILWKMKIPYGIIKQDFITIVNQFDTRKKSNIFGNGFSSELGLKEEMNKYEPQKNNYHCHIEDLNDSHSIIARRVKEGSTVLDIGCGVGMIGELLFKNKKCINYGIEIDQQSAQIAQKSGYYHNVFTISIENEEDRKIIEQENITFDYIILADVLEHMINPSEILYQVSKWLSKNGKILVSVPNIAYGDIIKGLLFEEFNYQKTGILDSTHLHFFTKRSFMEMIANFRITYQVNFDVEWLESTKFKNETFCLGENLNENGKYDVVQNIYELSQLENNDIPIKMLTQLNNRKKDHNQDMINQIRDCIELQQTLKEKNERLQTELNGILHSKSWKITSPLRKISKTINKN